MTGAPSSTRPIRLTDQPFLLSQILHRKRPTARCGKTFPTRSASTETDAFAITG